MIILLPLKPKHLASSKSLLVEGRELRVEGASGWTTLRNSPPPSTLNSSPSTINPHPSTLIPQPRNMYNFEKLDVWHVARELVTKVYRLLPQLPAEERFALCDQIRRAAISVPSNIAEGGSRISPKEQMRFMEIAYGSLMELYCQLLIAVDLGYLQKEDPEMKEVDRLINQTARMLSGLHKSLDNKK